MKSRNPASRHLSGRRALLFYCQSAHSYPFLGNLLPKVWMWQRRWAQRREEYRQG